MVEEDEEEEEEVKEEEEIVNQQTLQRVSPTSSPHTKLL